MSLMRSNSSSQTPIATNAQPAKRAKKGTTIVLPDDAWSRIVPYVDSKTLRTLECTAKTTRDAAVFRDVVNGSYSIASTPERHFVEFAKEGGYNVYFQDLFDSSTPSEVCPHQKQEAWFAKLGDIGTLKEKVQTGVTMGVLRHLK